MEIPLQNRAKLHNKTTIITQNKIDIYQDTPVYFPYICTLHVNEGFLVSFTPL